MWIDLIDSKGEVPLHRAIQQVIDRYDSSLKAEMTELSTASFSFRHGVCIIDDKGRPYPRSKRLDELAGELLVEYGKARGGEPAGFDIEQWDFGHCTGFAMVFIGGPTDPTEETRLTNSPSLPGILLRDREEQYVWMPPESREVENAKVVDG